MTKYTSEIQEANVCYFLVLVEEHCFQKYLVCMSYEAIDLNDSPKSPVVSKANVKI